MKKIVISAFLSLVATMFMTGVSAQEQKKVKTGWNFGPLPAVSYNSDLGFQYGALCDIFYYGDGTTFPQYVHKFNVEVSRYTKGSGIYHLFYDSKYLIPKVRLTFAATYTTSKMQPFYGFNGTSSAYISALAKDNPSFYGIDRNMFRLLVDFQGKITESIGWAAGVAFWDFRTGHVKIDKYRNERTLWDLYTEGADPVIPLHQQKGGSQLELKAGVVYDTRDHEPAPSRGIWAEVIAYGSPDVFERGGNEYLKLSAQFRQYITLIPNRLVAAYRLAYQGTVAGDAPSYIQQNISTLYLRQIASEGLGGKNTVRGILMNRIVGNGYFWGNVELRLRLFDFRFLKQDWYIALNPFFDAGMAVQPYRLDNMKATQQALTSADPADDGLLYTGENEKMHFSAGAGIKAVMNRNFIVSLEWGKPFDKRDGTSGMNIGLNYIF